MRVAQRSTIAAGPALVTGAGGQDGYFLTRRPLAACHIRHPGGRCYPAQRPTGHAVGSPVSHRRRHPAVTFSAVVPNHDHAQLIPEALA